MVMPWYYLLLVKITCDTSVLPMIWSDSNYHFNAMVAMEKITTVTADLP